MSRDGYKDTVRDPLTGRRREIREADYTINGDINVVGNLTQNGAEVGGGSVTLETPTGARDGVNKFFVFVGTPIAVFRNGVLASPDDYIHEGGPTTIRFNTAPSSGDITGLTQ